MISHDPINGAYTELFAGLHPSITEKNNGGWGKCPFITTQSVYSCLFAFSLVSPFGRIEPARKDLLDPHLGRKYWEWSESQVKPYM